MVEWLELHGIRISIVAILGVVIYLISQYIVPRFVKRTIAMGMQDKPSIEVKKRSHTVSNVIRHTIGVVIGIIVLFTILAEIGVNIGPALAGLGVLGIAVGFGAQSLVKDFVNGLFILMENQFGIGDVVKVGEIKGRVQEVSLRRTILRDMDGAVHYIPNGEIVIVSNYTREYSRVNMNITVAYKEDLDRVINVINRVCTRLVQEKEWKEKIIKTPRVLRVEALGDSGIDIKILGDTVPQAQWEIMGELRKRLKKEFDKEGVEIPYPHMQVYFAGKVPE